jgi:hypothetical protein
LAKDQGYNPKTHSLPYICDRLPVVSENLREELLDQALRRVSDEESYNFDIDIKNSKKKIKTNY